MNSLILKFNWLGFEMYVQKAVNFVDQFPQNTPMIWGKRWLYYY